MVDTLTKAERSARMARVRGKDTNPEVAIEAFNDVLKKHGKRAVVRNPLLG